ncbi:MAG: cbb3-type cytochrome c oxidase subunit I [Verrucomicrobia bacterium]|nr:cbb3-type cytochrome c oxidase subunit I [Verrucomicrobiota bacterium]
MSASATSAATAAAGPAPRDAAAAIAVSCRGPVVLLVVSASVWLVIGGVLGVVASIQLHAPGFLTHNAWLTVGRLRPASMNLWVYGFATQAGLGVLVWLVARLGGRRLLYPGAIALGAVLWNAGVTLGVVGILAGGTTGFEWLEMPRDAPPLLFLAFLLMAIGALANVVFGREPAGSVPQWYLVAALCWFAWVYPTACHLLLVNPVRGVLQAAVNSWFTSNLLGLWLTAVGLAVVFDCVPARAGRPLANRGLAVFGFWTLAVFGSWNGLAPWLGGPLPRWMGAVGVVANALLGLSVAAVAWNWHLTLRGRYSRCRTDWVLRFVVSGAVAYVLASVAGFLLGLPCLAAITSLTLAPVGRTQLALHGFVGLTLLGAIYDLLPRLLDIGWPSPRLIRFHWLASVVGVALVFVALTLGGLNQGLRLRDPDASFPAVIQSTVPFLGNASLGWTVWLAGQVAFLGHVARLLWRRCRQASFIPARVRTLNAAHPSRNP